mmetsp:Transcript_27409/g.68766  ORF Transcript_27409/g.68766 Transcript_27409/m.68766 type:complete len:118 (-) Transcript_27409:456-809(-)
MGMMGSIGKDLKYRMTIVGGKKTLYQIPPHLTLELAAKNERQKEAELQRKAGPKALKDQCWNCGVTVHEPMRCGRCAQALYCSKECQKEHWKNPPPQFSVSRGYLGSSRAQRHLRAS